MSHSGLRLRTGSRGGYMPHFFSASSEVRPWKRNTIEDSDAHIDIRLPLYPSALYRAFATAKFIRTPILIVA